MINYVNLYDLSSLYDDSLKSEKYVRYLTNFEKNKKYRHEEIEQIHKLISNLNLEYDCLNGFLYSYSFNQLSKEFDLLCFTEEYALNIELKTLNTNEKIVKQLNQNKHYLSFLNKKVIRYAYIASDNVLVKVSSSNTLEEASFKELEEFLINNKLRESIDLDSKYDSKEILVSPINEPYKFIEGFYILTEYQEKIKRDIVNFIEKKPSELFYAITGSAGTGKTMLVYDIAKVLSDEYKILMVHMSKLCKGHKILSQEYKNLDITNIDRLQYEKIKKYDLIIIDEAQRVEKSVLDKIIDEAILNKKHILFSYDHNQVYFDTKHYEDFNLYISNLCKNRTYRLTNKIRANKEMSSFVNSLFDIKKRNRDMHVSYSNIHVIYENDLRIINEIIKNNSNYQYISLDSNDYLKDYYCLNLVGQEFDNVIIHMTDDYYYDEDLKLKSNNETNIKLLYQGLTRVRKELILIISNKEILINVLGLLKNRS